MKPLKPFFAYKNSLLALAGAVALAACASKPPVAPPPAAVPKVKSGEQMLLESQNLAKYGERWKQGQQTVQEGEEAVRQGRAKVEEGQRLIDEGNRIMRESEEAYQGVKQ